MTPDNAFDQAVSRRLARLSHMPVDTSSLERAVRAQVGSPRLSWRRILRPIVAIAASLLFMAIVGVALLQNRSVQASADLMAQMHRDIVSGKVPTMRVDSIDDVNKMFAAFSANLPTLSTPPDTHLMSCCMRDIDGKGKRVGCVLLNDGGTPVTLTVADIQIVKPLVSDPVMHNGEAFHVQSSNELNMVMVDRGQHRICLIGQLPPEKLMTISDSLKF
jgi:hypothetical protein